MCGIAGWLGPRPEEPDAAERMAMLLAHRGPDARGIHGVEDAALVHTRLSIIDLSPAGAQPMSNEDDTIWVVFNGEIYNHREIQQELEAKGHRFRGRSDTEILPHLYEEEGPAFVERLRGIFVFALYDSRRRRLLLARDRFGVKPLFHTTSGPRLGFASEIRALRELPDLDLTPDRQAIADYAALLYIPAPQTLFRGIRSLLPGELLEACCDNGRVEWTTRSYHRWTLAPDPGLTPEAAVDRTAELIDRAVARQMESDVPLGALLSGGIDSSLVSAAAQRASGGVQTFNVRFSDAGYDETWAAVAVARHIGSHHKTLDMDESRGTWEHVTSLLRHAGQPFANTSLFAVHAVSRLMRKHVTVALSGDGGDEGFGGYASYARLPGLALWSALPSPLAAPVLGGARLLSRLGRLSDTVPDRLREMRGAGDAALLQTLLCWIRPEEHQRLCRDPIGSDLLPVRRWFEPQWEHQLPQGAGRTERLSALLTEVNTRLRLPDDFLFKVDIASMRESLEVRVPMLDEELFNFGLSLPHRLKVQGRQCKRVLRGAAARQLPPEVAAKSKQGFSVPVDSWIDSRFKEGLQATVLSPSARIANYFHPEAYGPVVEAFCQGRTVPGISRAGLYQRAIMLLSLELALAPAAK